MTTTQAWQAGQKYSAGELVTYDGLTYISLVAETSISTWIPDATPSLWQLVTGTPPTSPPAASNSTQTETVAAWSSSAIYTAGMQAAENGVIYQANWWTQGNDPLSNNGGAGSGQPWTIFTGPPAPPPPVPTAPTGLTASATLSTATSLTWNAASVPGGGVITGYAVFENGQQIATTTALAYAVSGLTAATSYKFAVDAIDAGGTSAQSAPIAVTTQAATPPPPPVDGVAGWIATSVYLAGMQASENGAIYQANWWTEGNDPSAYSGPAGSGQPWTWAGGTPPPPALPSVPTGVAALGTTSSVTLLTWNASTVPNDGTVTGYTVLQNGQQIETTTGTSAVVTGLSANATYAFSVEALDNAGTSAASVQTSVSTPAAIPPGTLSQVFSPYVDMGLLADENLLAISQASGVKDFTLAFVQSSGPGTVGWAGTGTIDQDSLPNGMTILSQVQTLQAEGGNITISFGGANGIDPASDASSAAQLQAEYQSVIDRYGVHSLDFDIEGAQVADQSAITLRDQALVGLKAANPGLTISFTLPVLPSGLDANGLNVLESAKADGLDPDVINLMAMDYGGSVDNGGEMGADAISAALNTEQQISFVGLTSKIGITPMIGVNDDSAEVFTLNDAQTLLDFAQSNPDVASLGMWSIARDNGNSAGAHYASPDSSGLAQSNYAFASIFKQMA
ncbi:MAG TPA: carbohydrate-binding protein [Acetobacteraceae bacterium]|jgi:chitodextrinase